MKSLRLPSASALLKVISHIIAIVGKTGYLDDFFLATIMQTMSERRTVPKILGACLAWARKKASGEAPTLPSTLSGSTLMCICVKEIPSN